MYAARRSGAGATRIVAAGHERDAQVGEEKPRRAGRSRRGPPADRAARGRAARRCRRPSSRRGPSGTGRGGRPRRAQEEDREDHREGEPFVRRADARRRRAGATLSRKSSTATTWNGRGESIPRVAEPDLVDQDRNRRGGARRTGRGRCRRSSRGDAGGSPIRRARRSAARASGAAGRPRRPCAPAASTDGGMLTYAASGLLHCGGTLRAHEQAFPAQPVACAVPTGPVIIEARSVQKDVQDPDAPHRFAQGTGRSIRSPAATYRTSSAPFGRLVRHPPRRVLRNRRPERVRARARCSRSSPASTGQTQARFGWRAAWPRSSSSESASTPT